MTDNVLSDMPAAAQATSSPAAHLKRPLRRKGVVIAHEKSWKRSSIWTLQVGIFVALIGGWELATRLGLIDPFFWSSPSRIYNAFIIVIGEGTLFQDTWFTFKATIIGFLLGSAIGAAIGLSLWWSINAAAVVQPYIVVFNAVPKIALGPLIILIFGIGISSKIALAVAFTAVITALAAYAGVRAVDDDLVKLTLSLGGRRRDVFLKIVVPSAMPWITSSLHINIGLALAGAIAGEFISSQYGLGKIIMYAGSTYDMALIWVGIIILALLAIVLYGAVNWLEHKFTRGQNVKTI
ncbi:NitT/TauT family transport system permease protein [Kaistia soli DSM 19436]|uniref:NitT/TauT family transport system permease protein n=1 Tax=Kaistia soli DSM 19436 TaxID=1122133 RepID=A0A1M5J4A8_9HYPH|nr:ABC transporter permease [Kaistia soli]SHG35361.1 NitT/TauT family transport system permease protein [Kaistia soli DSM 19436]